MFGSLSVGPESLKQQSSMRSALTDPDQQLYSSYALRSVLGSEAFFPDLILCQDISEASCAPLLGPA